VVAEDGDEDEVMVDEAEVVDTHLRKGIGPVLILHVAMLILLGGRVATDAEWTSPLTRGDPRAASRLAQTQLKKAKVFSQLMTGSVANAAMSTGLAGQLAMCATDLSSQWRRREQGSVEVLMSAERWSIKLHQGRRVMMSLMIWAEGRRNTRCRTRNP